MLIGITLEGVKEVIDYRLYPTESAEHYEEMLRDVRARDYDESEKIPQACVDEKRPGYFLCSDPDVTAKELYMALHRRWDTRTVLRPPQDQRVP